MTPGDLIDRNARRGSDLLSLGRRRGPAPQKDRREAAFLQAAARHEFGETDLLRFAQFRYRGGHGQKFSLSPNWRYRMLRGSIVCPQAISSTGTPNAAAIFARSAGLGVQRPQRMASTRPSGNPARSETSSMVSVHSSNNRSVVFTAKAGSRVESR